MIRRSSRARNAVTDRGTGAATIQDDDPTPTVIAPIEACNGLGFAPGVGVIAIPVGTVCEGLPPEP